MKSFPYKLMKLLGILFLLMLIIPILASLLLNKIILSSEAPKALRLFIMAVAPPNDLYDFLIKEEIDLSEKNSIRHYEFKNKYTGTHDVGILLKKFSADQYFKPISQRYDLKLKLQVNFYMQNRLLLSRVAEHKYDPFLGLNGNGFSFFYYECPEDLPLNKLITCEIQIIEPDSKLLADYGPVSFYIRKMSDK
jgi:hypothetical protein